MKTRIKKTEYADGSVEYLAQYRYNTQRLLEETASFPPIFFFWWIMWTLCVFKVWVDFGSGKATSELQIAKDIIDAYLQKIEDEKKERLAEKIVSTTYIKHP